MRDLALQYPSFYKWELEPLKIDEGGLDGFSPSLHAFCDANHTHIEAAYYTLGEATVQKSLLAVEYHNGRFSFAWRRWHMQE
jgi:hypothetical protein